MFCEDKVINSIGTIEIPEPPKPKNKDTNRDYKLRYTAKFNDIDNVKYQLSHGANVNSQDNNGKSALHEASIMGWTEIVKTLIDAGANVNLKDNEGKIPLHYAVMLMKKETMELLVSRGSCICALDNDNSTPLHYAATTDSLDYARFLVMNGADVTLKNKNGQTPLDRAKEMFKYCSDNPIVEFLEKLTNIDIEIRKGNTPVEAIGKEEERKVLNVNIQFLPIEKITDTLQIRKLQDKVITDLQGKINRIGFKECFPLLVKKTNGSFKLLDGNHRLEAVKRLNIQEVPAIVLQETITDTEEKKLAWENNEASETIAKTTFIDCAEFIWREAEGKTQEEIAGIMGWSREAVKNYSSLKKICKEAWELIGTTFENNVPIEKEGDVPHNGTTVPFTENLLRSILPLRPLQQTELVKDLISGSITKGRFKSLAQAYKARNEMEEYINSKLPQVGEELLLKAYSEIERGSYDKEWTEKKTDKLDKLIQSIMEEWQKKNSIQLINGDFYTEIKNIPDASIDLILTDPPYNVSHDREFVFEGRSNISQNKGEWDKFTKEEFIKLFDIWAKEFHRILKDNGSGYIFTSDTYISHIREALERVNLIPKTTIVWHKSNPGTQIIHTTNFKSSVEYIIFFVKKEPGFTFNWLGENEMQNFIETSICQGNERLKDSKGNTLHPTQKPEKLIRHFMDVSSNRGDMIFDGFMGVGTTGKVSKDNGRKFLGIEQDDNYFNAAQKRLL